MIPLETIQIAKPCSADWDAMTGDAQVRHCGACRLNVYNLSEMTRAQAEAVILEHEGHLCVRLYTRADGTVLTQDCPVGLRAFRLKAARKLSWAAALAVSCLTGLWRSEMAHAVTKPAAKPVPKSAAAARPAAKPHTAPPVLMGKPVLPHGWTMGAPPPPPPAQPRTAHKKQEKAKQKSRVSRLQVFLPPRTAQAVRRERAGGVDTPGKETLSG